MREALLLIAHGSPVPAANRDLYEMVQLVRGRRGDVIVEPAFLEGTSPSIPEGIATCVRQGAERVVVIPFFLLPGGHVSEDLPAFVEEARAAYPAVEFFMGKPLGGHEQLREMIWEQICELDHE
ncbi:CbiX/SirB N-terminal domain-containing protein [Tumebacillus sp. ITR2]|uniref:CbiX/SirB N-terminal domain-containing protein n=1 Tax=Tumebacillus amylolyticus TaxID=2801339 RepID=A0ABS1JBN8_9BACL|nr:CbiX/SirB N-terminal domain-containing protein [Tumebacillus amylolyticus]MBL0387683.1 CbiX/SirB N-terminal domain-containing protein [Tumebacillus amylolyticus]